MKNKEQTLNTMFSTIDKTIAIKQPKLLKINNNYNNNTNNEIINNQLKKEREKLKQNIINENIKYSNIKKPFENYSNFDKKIAQKSLKNGMFLMKNKPDFVKKLS